MYNNRQMFLTVLQSNIMFYSYIAQARIRSIDLKYVTITNFLKYFLKTILVEIYLMDGDHRIFGKVLV